MEKVVDAVGVGRLVDGVSPADRERAVRLLTDGCSRRGGTPSRTWCRSSLRAARPSFARPS